MYHVDSVNNVESSHFYFRNNTVPGVYPIVTGQSRIKVNNGSAIMYLDILTPNPTVDITTFGPPVTGYIEGHFNLLMRGATPSANVICNFRVKRQ